MISCLCSRNVDIKFSTLLSCDIITMNNTMGVLYLWYFCFVCLRSVSCVQCVAKFSDNPFLNNPSVFSKGQLLLFILFIVI